MCFVHFVTYQIDGYFKTYFGNIWFETEVNQMTNGSLLRKSLVWAPKSAFVENVTEKNHSQQTFIKEKVLTMKYGSKTCHLGVCESTDLFFPNANSNIFIFQTHIRLVADSLQKEGGILPKKLSLNKGTFNLKLLHFYFELFQSFHLPWKWKIKFPV